MEKELKIDKNLIAPCGMNCGLCLGYLREKNHCPGCNLANNLEQAFCGKCVIKNCQNLAKTKSKFCYECEKFPCLRMRQLDKRYRTRYNTSFLENLNQIKTNGLEKFVAEQSKIWQCKTCGGTICIHRNYCLQCKAKEGKK